LTFADFLRVLSDIAHWASGSWALQERPFVDSVRHKVSILDDGLNVAEVLGGGWSLDAGGVHCGTAFCYLSADRAGTERRMAMHPFIMSASATRII
jgi:hypothetical protein